MNEGKTKFGFQITIVSYTFDIVNKFVYRCSTVTSKTDVSLEIKRKIPFANACYYNLSRQFNSTDLSCAMNLLMYKSLIFPEIFNAVQACMLWTSLFTLVSPLPPFFAWRSNEESLLPKGVTFISKGSWVAVQVGSTFYDFIWRWSMVPVKIGLSGFWSIQKKSSM